MKVPLTKEERKEAASAATSSAEDDEVIHSSRVHKTHSRHTVLSESDSDVDDDKPKVSRPTTTFLVQPSAELVAGPIYCRSRILSRSYVNAIVG